jgi:hypothetical protein
MIDRKLRSTALRWRLLQLTQRLSVVGAAAAALYLLVGLAMIGGLISTHVLAGVILAVLAMLAFAVLLFTAMSTCARRLERSRVASALENVEPRLLDRVNTLVFLETQPLAGHAKPFVQRINRQANEVLRSGVTPSPYPEGRALAGFMAFLVVLAGTIWFYQAYSPWAKLTAAQLAKIVPPPAPAPPPDFSLPGTNTAETQAPAWGEVRITEPGADQKVTKVDVVPLQIEAASTESLRQVAWHATVNGAQESTNTLPPPPEPRYAVYKPTLYLDELRLADWDVVTYYAKASTDKSNHYASQIYFLEVRPFREDILKLPGGESGQAYQCLNELTGLIEEQQRVIRETHKFAQPPAEPSPLRDQDRGKLAAAETDLSQGSRHLYARMATELENKPIGEALDSLAKAERTLAQAAKQLSDDALTDAQNRERQALSELVAARKMFQKAVSEHPKDFADNEPEAPPIADETRKLKEMAEFRNEAKAAQDFVQITLEQQQRLSAETKTSTSAQRPLQAAKEKQLAKSLEEFQQQHPQAFEQSQAEAKGAQEALAKAADDLQKRSPDSQKSMTQATEELRQLNDALQRQAAEREMAQAYQLKQMLERQIETFGQCEKSGGTMPTEQVQQTAAAARQTLDELQKRAEQPPTRDAFGQPLREALSPDKKSAMDQQLKQLEQVRDDLRKKVGSGEAKRMLSQVSKAFDQSQPASMQAARQQDSLKPGKDGSFARGRAELEGLIQRLQEKHEPSRDNQAKQTREALANLQEALRENPGDNQASAQLLAQLDLLRKGEAPVDLEVLKRLAQELQRYSTQAATQTVEKSDQPEVTNIDPARLPPAYRGRIQKYFQKLSEK